MEMIIDFKRFKTGSIVIKLRKEIETEAECKQFMRELDELQKKASKWE